MERWETVEGTELKNLTRLGTQLMREMEKQRVEGEGRRVGQMERDHRRKGKC